VSWKIQKRPDDMVDSELRQAQLRLAIHDVYACNVNAWADRSLDPTVTGSDVTAQFKVDNNTDVQIVEVIDPAPVRHLVKYFIGTGLRLLKKGVDSSRTDIGKEDILGEISATFVVSYVSTHAEAPTQSMLMAFSDNVVHHMWPYWREFLQSATARFRLPAVVLPMRLVQQSPQPSSNPNLTEKPAVTERHQ